MSSARPHTAGSVRTRCSGPGSQKVDGASASGRVSKSASGKSKSAAASSKVAGSKPASAVFSHSAKAAKPVEMDPFGHPTLANNHIEQSRAYRNVKALHKQLNMPVPKLPAVLSYLRWLDKMETWNGRKRLSTFNEALMARRNDPQQLYSWNGAGNPTVLPKIKKYPDAEKYRSAQVKGQVFNDAPRLVAKSGPVKKSADDGASSDSGQRSLADWYKIGAQLGVKGHEQPVEPPESRKRSKPTAFYVHAMNGFKYWPEELYKSPDPPTKYTFGERFRPGRAGVVVDRIYAKPRANKHYWTEFQQHQNPIGSGNTVAGKILNN